MLYVAIGIIGATVMPHNLYLHSSIVQTRKFERTPAGKREAIKFGTIDSSAALMFALFINSAILILAGLGFPLVGAPGRRGRSRTPSSCSVRCLAWELRARCSPLRCSRRGKIRRSPGRLAGQIVMEGFLNFRIAPWLRR